MPSARNREPRPRREFLVKTALLGAAALFGGRFRRTARAAAKPGSPSAAGSRYRLTEHIRTYYERASL